MDLPEADRLPGDLADDMFAEFTSSADIEFDYTRRKFLLAVGLPESATDRAFEWDGWTAGLIRKGLGILAENRRLDMPAVVAEALNTRATRRKVASEKVAEAERELQRAQDAVRLVESRRLLAALLPTDEVVGLLHRYEGHHFRQMREAVHTLHRLQRAKAARSGPESATADATD